MARNGVLEHLPDDQLALDHRGPALCRAHPSTATTHRGGYFGQRCLRVRRAAVKNDRRGLAPGTTAFGGRGVGRRLRRAGCDQGAACALKLDRRVLVGLWKPLSRGFARETVANPTTVKCSSDEAAGIIDATIREETVPMRWRHRGRSRESGRVVVPTTPWLGLSRSLLRANDLRLNGQMRSTLRSFLVWDQVCDARRPRRTPAPRRPSRR